MDKNQLVSSVAPLIYKKAHKYALKHNLSGHVDDLFQEGAIGAMSAADSWDETAGKFTTYADDAINWAFSAYAKRRRQKSGRVENACVDNSEEVFSSMADNSCSPLRYAQMAELQAFIEELNNDQQESLAKWLEHGESSSCAAAELGISRQLMNNRLVWAMERLRNKYIP